MFCCDDDDDEQQVYCNCIVVLTEKEREREREILFTTLCAASSKKKFCLAFQIRKVQDLNVVVGVLCTTTAPLAN